MAEPYKAKSITITLTDSGENCAVMVTADPPIPERSSLKDNEQPCVAYAYAILAAIMENVKSADGALPFSGMRPLK